MKIFIIAILLLFSIQEVIIRDPVEIVKIFEKHGFDKTSSIIMSKRFLYFKDKKDGNSQNIKLDFVMLADELYIREKDYSIKFETFIKTYNNGGFPSLSAISVFARELLDVESYTIESYKYAINQGNWQRLAPTYQTNLYLFEKINLLEKQLTNAHEDIKDLKKVVKTMENDQKLKL